MFKLDDHAAQIKLKEHVELTYPAEPACGFFGKHSELSSCFFNSDVVIRFLRDGLYVNEGAIKRGQRWTVYTSSGFSSMTNTQVRQYLKVSNFTWRQIT